jgi:hypothetical protein
MSIQLFMPTEQHDVLAGKVLTIAGYAEAPTRRPTPTPDSTRCSQR